MQNKFYAQEDDLAVKQDKREPMDAPKPMLKENYNAVTTVLGTLVGAVNETNKRVNELEQMMIDQGILK